MTSHVKTERMSEFPAWLEMVSTTRGFRFPDIIINNLQTSDVKNSTVAYIHGLKVGDPSPIGNFQFGCISLVLF